MGCVAFFTSHSNIRYDNSPAAQKKCAKRLVAVLKDPHSHLFSNAIFENHLIFAKSLLQIVPECASLGLESSFERSRTKEALQLFFDHKIPLEVERQSGRALTLRACAGDVESVKLLLNNGFRTTSILYFQVL